MRTRISDAKIIDGQLTVTVLILSDGGDTLSTKFCGLPNDFEEKHVRYAQQCAVYDYLSFCKATEDQTVNIKLAQAEAEKALER